MALNRLKDAAKRLRAFHYIHVARLAGVRHLVRRERILRHVDQIAPRRTMPWRPGQVGGDVEIHVLLRHQDVRPALWTLHSFFTAAGVDWPVVFHEGGRMDAKDWSLLRAKFPNAAVLPHAEADALVNAELAHRAMPSSAALRGRSPTIRKVVDPVVLSCCTTLFILDTDVLFFRRPDELLDIAGRADHVDTFNRDPDAYPYGITRDVAMQRFGVEMARNINYGVCLINRPRVRLDRVEQYSADPVATENTFFVDQTIMGLLAGEFGSSLLPPTYACSKLPGLETTAGDPLVAKHYISTPRPLLFEEGMVELSKRGMLRMAE